MLDFPSAPSVDQTFTVLGQTWRWDGAAWVLDNAPEPDPGTYLALTGGTVTGPLTVDASLTLTDNLLQDADGTKALYLRHADGTPDAAVYWSGSELGLRAYSGDGASVASEIALQPDGMIELRHLGSAKARVNSSGFKALDLIEIEAAQYPSVRLVATSAPTNLKKWLLYGTDTGNIGLQARLDDNSPASGPMLIIERDTQGITDIKAAFSAVSPSTASLINRDRGDARYLQLAGGTITGQATIKANFNVAAKDAASNTNLFLEDDAARRRGVLYWDRATEETRLRAYATDGATKASEIILGANKVTFDGLLKIAVGSVASSEDDFSFGPGAANLAAGAHLNLTAGRDETWGAIHFYTGNGTGTEGTGSRTRVGVLEPDPDGLALAESVITRRKGDARYIAAARSQLGSVLFLVNRSGGTLTSGSQTAGSNLRYGGTGTAESTSGPAGTWETWGRAEVGAATLFYRVA